MERAVASCFRETLREAAALLDRGGEHMLLCGLDPDILDTAVCALQKHTAERAVLVRSAQQKDGNPQGKVFFVHIGQTVSAALQTLVYYYLERSREGICSLVLTSLSCFVLDSLEKRVKSRFNHRVFFLGFLPLAPYTALGRPLAADDAARQHRMNPTLSALRRASAARKHRIPEYSMDMFYELLGPVHIALLILASKKRLRYTGCVSEFRRFTTDTNELRRVDSNEIMFCLFDLLDAGVVDQEGDLLVDATCFRRHLASRPLHLRSLMHRTIG